MGLIISQQDCWIIVKLDSRIVLTLQQQVVTGLSSDFGVCINVLLYTYNIL